MGSNANAFFLQVRPHASQPMHPAAFSTFANILADSSSSTSAGARTSWAQILMQRPHPMQSSGSIAFTNFGVHSLPPRDRPELESPQAGSVSRGWFIALRSQGGGFPRSTSCSFAITSAIGTSVPVLSGWTFRATSFAAGGPPIATV